MLTSRVLNAVRRQAMVTGRRAASTSSGSGNAFIAEREQIKQHSGATAALWKKISIFGVIPALVLASGNAYYLWNEHWEHWSHLPPLEDRIEYPYQNIRTKNFPWGDGDKSFFWMEGVNYHRKD